MEPLSCRTKKLMFLNLTLRENMLPGSILLPGADPAHPDPVYTSSQPDRCPAQPYRLSQGYPSQKRCAGNPHRLSLGSDYDFMDRFWDGS